eukprot:600259-Rhodomonas_salina.1
MAGCYLAIRHEPLRAPAENRAVGCPGGAGDLLPSRHVSTGKGIKMCPSTCAPPALGTHSPHTRCPHPERECRRLPEQHPPRLTGS